MSISTSTGGSVSEPGSEPASEPVNEPVSEPVADPISGPVSVARVSASPRRAPFERSPAAVATRGCDRRASSMTAGSSALVSYGHITHPGTSAKLTLASTSWWWHSTSSAALRPGHTGWPMPRSRRPGGRLASMNWCQAAMIRVGLRPTSAMSTQATRSAAAPSASRNRDQRSAVVSATTTSPASSPSRKKGVSVPRYSSSSA
jgi:hypothetical protein